jgi:hypothetical protein
LHTTLSDKVLEVAPRTDAGDTDGIGALLGRKFMGLLVEYGQDQFGGSVLIPLGSGASCTVRPKIRSTSAWWSRVRCWLLRCCALYSLSRAARSSRVKGLSSDTELYSPLDGIGLVGRTNDDHIAIGTLDSDLADQVEAEDVGKVQVKQDEVRTQRHAACSASAPVCATPTVRKPSTRSTKAEWILATRKSSSTTRTVIMEHRPRWR